MFSALPPKDGVIGRPSLWIAEDFWVLRFGLMVKRGLWLRPQASEGGSAAWTVLLDWMYRSRRPASVNGTQDGSLHLPVPPTNLKIVL